MAAGTPQASQLDIIDLFANPSREDVFAYAVSVPKKCSGECKEACPLGIDIPNILDHIRKNDFQKARDVIGSDNPFPSLCGRFCSAPCQAACACSVQFKAVERFLGDSCEPTRQKIKMAKHKVAIVGAGIAGLMVASVLQREGIPVRLIEATERAGGMILRTTPDFRLPPKIADQEVSRLCGSLEFVGNTIGGTTVPLEELSKQCAAVVIATGANKPAFLGIPGEHLKNVHSVIDFLSTPQRKSSDTTIVIGGTTQAIDAARAAMRLGDDVTILFHKIDEDMPADASCVLEAKREGVKFHMLTKPRRFLGKDKVTGIECAPMMLEESELGESKVAVPMEGSEFVIPCTKAIIAVGLEPNPTVGRYSSIRTVGKGRVWTNEYHQTNIPNIFAAGEIAIGSSPVEKTLAHAKQCALHVKAFLKGEIDGEE